MYFFVICFFNVITCVLVENSHFAIFARTYRPDGSKRLHQLWWYPFSILNSVMTLFLSLPFPPLRCESRPFDIWTVGRLRQMRSTNHVSPSKAHLRLASLDLRHFIDIFLKGQPLHGYSVVWAFLFIVSVERTLARGYLLRGELWLRHSGVLFTTDH